MSTVAVISDTHIPRRADAIPPSFQDRIAGADHTIHAGDFTAPGVLETIDQLSAGALTAVSGNMDPPDFGLPLAASVEVDGLEFVVVHGAGPPETYEERIARVVEESATGAAVGVAGHTHDVLDTTVDGVRLLNPGSLTAAAPADRSTMMTVEIDADDLTVAVHEP